MSDDDIRVFDGTLAPGLGHLTSATAEDVRMAASIEGLFVDPVYTGKTLAGVIAMARDGALAGQKALSCTPAAFPALAPRKPSCIGCSTTMLQPETSKRL